MKHFFKLALAFVFVLSMTACGEAPEDIDNHDDPQQNIQQDNENPGDAETHEKPESPENEPEEPELPVNEPAESESPEESSEPGVPEVSDEPETSNEDLPQEEIPFDTAWASNAYEKLIPQPPFDGWTGEMKGSNVYELFTSKANVDESGEYYNVFHAYLDSLKALGFSIDGEVYSCSGFDEFGNEFKFKCGDGCAWITIMPVENLG